MGQTIIEKIVGRNVGHDVHPGDIVTVNVDRVMIHDIFNPFVAEKFEEMGFTKLHDPDKVVLIYDHLVPASQQDDTRHFRTGDAFADVLLGRAYPSGKLTMTWAPIGEYASTEGFGDPNDTEYKEGIYV